MACLLVVLLLLGVAALGETHLLSGGGSSLFVGCALRGADAPDASLGGLPPLILLGHAEDSLSQLAQRFVRSQAGHLTISELSPSPSGCGVAPQLDGQLGDALAVFLGAVVLACVCAGMYVLAWCGALAWSRARGRSRDTYPESYTREAARAISLSRASGGDAVRGDTTFASGVQGAASVSASGGASPRNFRGEMTFAPREKLPARGARSSLG